MTHQQAKALALSLMKQHGITQAGWQFKWSHGKQQLGACQIKRVRDRITGKTTEFRTIKLSKYLVALNSDDEVRDTILHEIAHALAGLKHGHNHVWKAVCQRIGAKPQRVADRSVRVVEARYHLICGCCQRMLAKRHRLPDAGRMRNVYCRYCGLSSKGLLRVHDQYAAAMSSSYA